MNSASQEAARPAEGARTFQVAGSVYDLFMGRYSQPLAVKFADLVGIKAGMSALDVGCGPGALTSVLVDGLGVEKVAACDPSAAFIEESRARLPDVDIRLGRAEAIPFETAAFDAVLAQLVLHFVSDPAQAAREFARVLRPGGVAAACMWEGMQMLRYFWDAALSLNPQASDKAQTPGFGGEGEICELLSAAGFRDVREATLTVSSPYASFDELWAGFLAGIGPAGAYLVGLSEQDRGELRSRLFENLGSPAAPFTLEAVARCAWGRSAK